MKKPTKIILKLLNLIVLLILFGCEKDLYEEPIHQSKIKIEKFSVSDISSGKSINSYELLKSISKAKAKFKLSNNKIIYDSINDFYFDDENGYKISEDDKESYTFQLHRNQENELSKIENIIFSLNKEGYYDSFISKYIYTEIEIKNKTIAELGDSEVIYTPIDSNKMELLCIDVITVYSGCTETHENGETCCNTTMTTTLWCGWLDSGGGGGGSGGSGSGSGSGGGSGGGGGSGSGGGGSANNPNLNTNSIELPILTMPVHGTPIVISPCSKIKNQFTKFPTLKQSLIDLATTTSQIVENGLFIDNSSTSTTQNPVQTIPTGSSGTIDINANPSIPYLMIAHTHSSPAESTYSVFSFSDLDAIATLINNNHINSNFVFYVMTADGTRYAMTIDNPQSFSDFFYHPMDHPGEEFDWGRAKTYTKLVGDYYNNEPPLPKPFIQENSNNNQIDLKNFLSFLKKANLGATVFKVSPDFNTFTKVTLSSNNNTIQYDNCN